MAAIKPSDLRLTVGDGFRVAFGFWLFSLFLIVVPIAFVVLILWAKGGG